MEENTTKEEVAEQKKKKTTSRLVKIAVAFVVVLIVGFFGFTTEVREGSSAVILRFGAPRAEITEAGLYFKLPWPFETVKSYDSRVQYVESSNLETTTKDKRNVILQSYALYRVTDPLKFHNSIGSTEQVESYIKDQIFSATNGVLGSYNLTALVSLEKEEIRQDEIQQKIYEAVSETCEANYGVTIDDVSILRISFPDTNLTNVFEQMKADRQKEIDAILAEARKNADKIVSDADTEYARIVAQAEVEAAEINAKTEAEVAKIYAEAQAANLELYQFLRELDTITSSVSESTVLVVTADSYPFNILLNYSEMLTDESDETVCKDLNYILQRLPEQERNDLINAVYQLIRESGKVQE